jgi:hypothetical protein
MGPSLFPIFIDLLFAVGRYATTAHGHREVDQSLLNHPYLFTPLALKWQSASFPARRWNFQGKSLIGYRIRPGIDWLAQGDAAKTFLIRSPSWKKATG